ncbi:hypothetical protein HMPREF9554_00782 [Treponema phagedenis F0421]|nr:hypothetical protein HMPREF9554_00782 [Treponema phagedenis F0421]
MFQTTIHYALRKPFQEFLKYFLAYDSKKRKLTKLRFLFI